METKLKLVFQSQKLRLAFRALIFAGLLAWVKLGGLSFPPVLIFLASSAFLYASPLFKTMEMIRPFLILLIVSLLSALSVPAWSLPSLAIYYGLLFYLLLGVKNLVFLQRIVWHRILNFSMAYPVFLLFFHHNQTDYLFRAVPLFIILLFLFSDFFQKRFLSWLLALILLEIVWAISLLPIGFFSAASLAFLSYFTVSDLFRRQSEKSLTKEAIINYATLFSVIFLFILGSSRWSL